MAGARGCHPSFAVCGNTSTHHEIRRRGVVSWPLTNGAVFRRPDENLAVDGQAPARISAVVADEAAAGPTMDRNATMTVRGQAAGAVRSV